MDEHGGSATNEENKQKTYSGDSKNENQETTEETEDNLDMLVPHELPVNRSSDCTYKGLQSVSKHLISVGGKEKCTKLQSNKDARGGKADFSLCFDEWKYFSIQNSSAVNPNQIMVELLFFEPAARDSKPMGSAFFNVLKVLNESIVTHQFNVMLNKQVVCKLDVEMAITYGSFGYGHSHQLKHPERTVEEQVEKSLFPHCPSPKTSKIMTIMKKTIQSDIISHLIQRDNQGGRDSSDLMNQIEKSGSLELSHTMLVRLARGELAPRLSLVSPKSFYTIHNVLKRGVQRVFRPPFCGLPRLFKLYKTPEKCETKQDVVQFLEKLVMRQEPESPWTTNNLESENQPTKHIERNFILKRNLPHSPTERIRREMVIKRCGVYRSS